MMEETKLKVIREEKKLSISRISDLTNLSKSYLYQLEKGCKSPSKETMKKISRALNVGVETLFFQD